MYMGREEAISLAQAAFYTQCKITFKPDIANKHRTGSCVASSYFLVFLLKQMHILQKNKVKNIKLCTGAHIKPCMSMQC